MCDECTWHHKTFLVQLYCHLAIKLYLWFWFAQVLTPEANPQWMESEDLVTEEVQDGAGECLLPWWRSILPAWLLDLHNADAVATRPA